MTRDVEIRYVGQTGDRDRQPWDDALDRFFAADTKLQIIRERDRLVGEHPEKTLLTVLDRIARIGEPRITVDDYFAERGPQ